MTGPVLLPQPGGFAHLNDKWLSDVGRLQVSVLLREIFESA
jgi:hypothetical protein